jgi:hypothetical protein
MNASPALLKNSNPSQVLVNAKKYGYDPSSISESKTKTKKYVIITPEGKRVNFGQKGYEDYTKHGDEERRARFRTRNARWANAPKYSPARLSWCLLW